MRKILIASALVTMVAGIPLSEVLAQPATEGQTTCMITQFVQKKGKPGAAVKKCDRLKDVEATPVKSIQECKDRAVRKADECLALAAGIEQLSVSGRFAEKVGVTEQGTKFTCEKDRLGGLACP
ncbi:MAG: hypothetical protein HC902_10135 [Calothrix sp. SM1_5_4]|nr:hypothetical protein [Calothrix sp. SM1_5_4]